MELAEPEKARKWGASVLAILLGLAGFILWENSRGTERDTRDMDRGIVLLIDALESGQRSDFITAQKVFLDVNSGWIVDEYAVFAIQATERLRIRVAGPDDGEVPSDDATAPYYRAIADGELERARSWAVSHASEAEGDHQARSKYMLRFVSDIARIGGEDVVERIRGR